MADAVLEGQQGVSNEEVAAEQNIDLDEKRKKLKMQKQLKKNTSVESKLRNSLNG